MENEEKDQEAEQGNGKDETPGRSLIRDLMPWHWGERKGEMASEDPFEALQNTINRLFNTFRRDRGLLRGNGGDLGIASSKMDVSETDENYEVIVELPGMDEKNIDVAITNDTLTIHGEKKHETDEKKKNYHYRECSYGSIERIVPLPSGVDVDKVSATFRKGVLTVTLPKTPEATKEGRKVEVKAA